MPDKRIGKVQQQIECSTCPWNRNCIEPPVMTEEEVKAKIDEDKPQQGLGQKDAESSILGGIMSVMFFGGKDREAIVCPIFANALRSGPELSRSIKSLMQSSI